MTYVPALFCQHCGGMVAMITPEQEARRAADPERFVVTCSICLFDDPHEDGDG